MGTPIRLIPVIVATFISVYIIATGNRIFRSRYSIGIVPPIRGSCRMGGLHFYSAVAHIWIGKRKGKNFVTYSTGLGNVLDFVIVWNIVKIGVKVQNIHIMIVVVWQVTGQHPVCFVYNFSSSGIHPNAPPILSCFFFYGNIPTKNESFIIS